MKRQNGFISSSSSVSITYSTRKGPGITTESWSNLQTIGKVIDVHDGDSYNTTDLLSKGSSTVTFTWNTYASTAYQRIEYFMEAVEKLNSPFEKNNLTYTSSNNYSWINAEKDLYTGFVDILLTFPVEIRLAGIELFNPWINKFVNGSRVNDWKYLPSEFKIYKVNNNILNDNLDYVTYENSVARDSSLNDSITTKFRPVKYSGLDYDKYLTLLGNYKVNWENTSSYRCFFKFNSLDPVSVNMNIDDESVGTATWRCKQLVIRIFKTKMTNALTSDANNFKDTSIWSSICKWIVDKETSYGTRCGYDRHIITEEDASNLYGYEIENMKIYNVDTGNEVTNKVIGNTLFHIDSTAYRRYKYVSDFCFESGLKYKLGGIQLLLSPDVFAVAEMKMYSYNSKPNSKVYVGEWSKDFQEVEYYGTGVIKTSQYIDISDLTMQSVTWKHNFNVPPKYLDAQVFARFNMDYQDFYAGDVIGNLVNINKEPLTVRLTGTDVQVSIANGICFTNPSTGEFMTFLNGTGVQLDRPGNFDAYNAALKVEANIIDYGSSIASTMKGGYPFDLYFVVKRLF